MKWEKPELNVAERSGSVASAEFTFPAFAPLISDAFDHLSNLPERTEVQIGETIVHQGVKGEAVCLIVSGLAKLVCMTVDGRQATVGLRTAGWYAGAVFVLMNTVSVYSVVPVTPCVIVRIPAEKFSLRLMQSARMMRHFTTTLCNEIITQSAAQAEVMTGSAEQRLAQYMSERTTDHPKWKTLDTLPLLKQGELAHVLSITPEHLSRLLHKSPKHSSRIRRH